MIWLQNCVVVFSCLQQSLALLFKGLQFAVHVCCSVGILHVDDCPVSSVPLYLQANHFTLNASKYWLAPGTDLNFLWDLRSSYLHYFIKPNENKSTHPQTPAHASLNGTLKTMIFHWQSSETVPKSCCNFNDHLTFLSWIFPSDRPSLPSAPPPLPHPGGTHEMTTLAGPWRFYKNRAGLFQNGFGLHLILILHSFGIGLDM